MIKDRPDYLETTDHNILEKLLTDSSAWSLPYIIRPSSLNAEQPENTPTVYALSMRHDAIRLVTANKLSASKHMHSFLFQERPGGKIQTLKKVECTQTNNHMGERHMQAMPEQKLVPRDLPIFDSVDALIQHYSATSPKPLPNISRNSATMAGSNKRNHARQRELLHPKPSHRILSSSIV